MKLDHPQLKAMATMLFQFITDIYLKRDGRIIILYGRNGCGKTHAAKAVVNWFEAMRLSMGPVHVAATTDSEAEARIVDCIYRSWPMVVDQMKSDQWLVFEQMMVEYFVVLDDIGAEHDPSGAGLEKLYLILSRRERMHTLITTNFPPAEWEKKFERRIASRLFRDTMHVDLTQVPDYYAE